MQWVSCHRYSEVLCVSVKNWNYISTIQRVVMGDSIQSEYFTVADELRKGLIPAESNPPSSLASKPAPSEFPLHTGWIESTRYWIM